MTHATEAPWIKRRGPLGGGARGSRPPDRVKDQPRLSGIGPGSDFRENLWNKLWDEALLDGADLTESLSQMNAGNVQPALTFDEKREERRSRR
jgi:hypothetical protein